MKKVFKIILIIFLVIAVLLACLAIWQRKNIAMLYTAVTNEREDITKKQEDNNKVLVDEVNGYLDGELREPTREEKESIKKGETQITDVYSTIIKEHIDKKNQEATNIVPPEKNTETIPEVETSEETQPNEENTVDITKKTDELVSNAISKLYDLQSAYAARSEALIHQAMSEYNSIRAEGMERPAARSQIISTYTPKVRTIQNSCDADVESVVVRLENELKSINANLGIIKTIRETYEKEKQLKLAYYAGAYLD